jgi:glycolate oxidase FAD binding subunit
MAADRASLVDEAISRFGVRVARSGDPSRTVSGVTPTLVIEPGERADVGPILAWASKHALTVVPSGGGTKLEWGRVPIRVDVLLSLRRLTRVIAHRAGDLTATVEAGAPLAWVNQELAGRGQWLPLDPPGGDRTTIGGIVATNDSGPRRLRYGAPRDLIIGIEFARSDGCVGKAGGYVVKNVAGYDLSKLLAGSFGTLAVVLSATFKLAPIPAASCTVLIDVSSLEALGPLLRATMGSQFAPSAVELQLPPLRVLVRFESIAEAVSAQAEAMVALARDHGALALTVVDDDERDLWRGHAARPWDEPGIILKIGTLPTHVPGILMALQGLMREHHVSGEAVGRAAMGVLIVRLDGEPVAQVRVIDELRRRLGPDGGYAVLVRASPDVRGRVDVWGRLDGGARVMQAVKQRFDPEGILGAGRGPV